MLYHLKGRVEEVFNNAIVIDCSGIGFYISTTNKFNDIDIGKEIKLFISENIKEDSFDLYGFTGLFEKEWFDLLVTISGVGPKAALSILSMMSPSDLVLAILNNDEKAISQAPGIGKKTAQRIIIELKDKVGNVNSNAVSNYIINKNTDSVNGNSINEAMNALIVLGYTSQEINNVLREIDTSNMSAEEIVKNALKKM